MLGFSLPFYNSPTLLLSLGLSVRVLWRLLTHRPDVIHVSSPGFLVFAATLYAKLLSIPLVRSQRVFRVSVAFLAQADYLGWCHPQTRSGPLPPCSPLLMRWCTLTSAPAFVFARPSTITLHAARVVPSPALSQKVEQGTQMRSRQVESAACRWCRIIRTSPSTSLCTRGRAWWSQCGTSSASMC